MSLMICRVCLAMSTPFQLDRWLQSVLDWIKMVQLEQYDYGQLYDGVHNATV